MTDAERNSAMAAILAFAAAQLPDTALVIMGVEVTTHDGTTTISANTNILVASNVPEPIARKVAATIAAGPSEHIVAMHESRGRH